MGISTVGGLMTAMPEFQRFRILCMKKKNTTGRKDCALWEPKKKKTKSPDAIFDRRNVTVTRIVQNFVGAV